MNWIVSQVGARQHYATPRAFQRRGELRTFYTDAWAGRMRGLLARGPGRTRALADRFAADLPPEKVISSTAVTLFEQATAPLRIRHPSVAATHDEWSREGRRFATWVNRRLARRPPDPATDAFYGCKTVCLETLRPLRDRGIFTLVDQADPSRVEEELVRQERARWPGWERMSDPVPASYYGRCAAEWAAADVVLVYSDWTRDAIASLGVPAEKIIVVPLAYEGNPTPPRTVGTGDRITVLWLGHVMLRKGIPYLIEAARQLQDRPIDFVVAGQVHISDEAVRSAPANVRFIGRVFRGAAAEVYRSADLFVLPTISDSFALTQVEAMAHGLPVIATARCGKVVTDGVDGRLVPTADAAALAAAIAGFAADRSTLRRMSDAARAKAATFTLDAYGQQVHDEVTRRRPSLAPR
jgi:glycosyltransferase involved in cell wall biosynthesis